MSVNLHKKQCGITDNGIQCTNRAFKSIKDEYGNKIYVCRKCYQSVTNEIRMEELGL